MRRGSKVKVKEHLADLPWPWQAARRPAYYSRSWGIGGVQHQPVDTPEASTPSNGHDGVAAPGFTPATVPAPRERTDTAQRDANGSIGLEMGGMATAHEPAVW